MFASAICFFLNVESPPMVANGVPLRKEVKTSPIPDSNPAHVKLVSAFNADMIQSYYDMIGMPN